MSVIVSSQILAPSLCSAEADILCVSVYSYWSYYNVTLTFQARAAALAVQAHTHVCITPALLAGFYLFDSTPPVGSLFSHTCAHNRLRP